MDELLKGIMENGNVTSFCEHYRLKIVTKENTGDSEQARNSGSYAAKRDVRYVDFTADDVLRLGSGYADIRCEDRLLAFQTDYSNTPVVHSKDISEDTFRSTEINYFLIEKQAEYSAERGSFFSRHPRLCSALVILLIGIMFRVVPSLIEALGKQPQYELAQQVTDKGEYLPADEYFSPKENIGMHFLLACKPKNDVQKYDPDVVKNKKKKKYHSPEKTEDGYLYYYVINLRNPKLEYLLLSDERYSSGNYMEFDCIVTGSYTIHLSNAITSQESTETLPVLKVVKVKNTDCKKIDYAAPLITVDKPKTTVTKDSVKISLDRVEYRKNICRFFLTVENKTDYEVGAPTGVNIEQNSTQINGVTLLSNYVAPLGLDDYYENSDETLLPGLLSPHTKYNVVMVTKVFNEDEDPLPVNIKLKVKFNSDQINKALKNNDLKNVEVNKLWEKESELELEYIPMKNTAATPDGK